MWTDSLKSKTQENCSVNREVRDPYASWCERCTRQLFVGGPTT